MALSFSLKVKGTIGGKMFRAFEVTADGSAMTIFAHSIEMGNIDTAIVSPRQDLSSAASIDFGSIASLAGNTSAITVTGAALGDFTMQAMSVDVDDLTMASYVQDTNKVEVRTDNLGGAGTTDLGDSVRRIRVLRHIGLSVLSGRYIVFQPALQSGDIFTVWAIGH